MAGAEYIPTMYLISAGIACLTCFSRPDYNLPLMAFAFLTWDHNHVRFTYFPILLMIDADHTEEKGILYDVSIILGGYTLDTHMGNILE